MELGSSTGGAMPHKHINITITALQGCTNCNANSSYFCSDKNTSSNLQMFGSNFQ